MLTPSLETERILLRPLSTSDAETIFAHWTSDPEVARFMRWDLHRSPKDTFDWLTLEERTADSDKNFTWGFVLKETQELFGSGGCVYSASHQAYELGYNIMRKHWNKGLATEASRAVLEFIVNTFGVRSFYACHASDNTASGKVLEKLGFVYQTDGFYTSFDGSRSYMCREYALRV